MGLPLYNPSESTLYLSELDPGPDDIGVLTRRLAGPTRSAKYHRRHRPSNYITTRLHNFTERHVSKPPRNVNDLDLDVREGRDQARSSSYLPRRPSLEREEAFCGSRPPKRRRPSPSHSQDESEDEDETVRELYRLGLLYDDPHSRGERFTFDAIVHDQPGYSVTFGGNKRSKRRLRQRDGEGWGCGLPLELSFAALGDDGRLARLMAPDESEMDSVDGWTPDRAVERHPGCRQTGVSMRVIYEVETEEPVHVDGHERGETQTTTRSLSSANDFPELVSDSEHDDEGQEDGGREEIQDELEAWVVLG